MISKSPESLVIHPGSNLCNSIERHLGETGASGLMQTWG
jgi:hypothetical protein